MSAESIWSERKYDIMSKNPFYCPANSLFLKIIQTRNRTLDLINANNNK